MDVPTALLANQANWDDRAAIHAASAMYDLDGFVVDPTRISDVAAEDLELLTPHLPARDISGLDVVHLQCHIGTDTLSLARRGASVTGVDLSPRSLDIARQLAERCGLDATFVQGDVTRAAELVTGEFDVVYTSIGTVTWLPDLSAWAQSIARLLRAGGTFYIRDGHPMLYTLDDERADALVVRHRYFPTGQAQTWLDPSTYTGEGEVSAAHARTYEWPHSLSEIIGALLSAGLRITSFSEQRTVPWPAHPLMEQEGSVWVLPEQWRDAVPLTYAITATTA